MKRIQGRIRYTSKKPELMDTIRGSESFMMTWHEDQTFTLRAHCEILEPNPTVLRDVIYSTDKRGQPMDCHIRLTVGDSFMGSGWFRFDLDDSCNGRIECESYSPSLGRLSERVDTKGTFDCFGTHPIVGDALTCRVIDRTNGPTKRRIRVFLPSPDHRGATAPKTSEVYISLEYVGDERVCVEAGGFDCHHFRFIDEEAGGMGGKQHPVYDVWVRQEDFLFVKGGVGGYMMTWYELVELSEG